MDADAFVEILADGGPDSFGELIHDCRVVHSPIVLPPRLTLRHKLDAKELRGEPLVEPVEVEEEDERREDCI